MKRDYEELEEKIVSFFDSTKPQISYSEEELIKRANNILIKASVVSNQRRIKKSILSFKRGYKPILSFSLIVFAVLLSFVVFVRFYGGKDSAKIYRIAKLYIKTKVGNVWIYRGEEGKKVKGYVGAILKPDDVVVTLANSSAVLETDRGDLLYLKEDTEFQIKELLISKGYKENFFLRVGRAFFRVLELGKGDSFLVSTPSAVAGVRGTFFSVGVFESGDTVIDVVKGKVEVFTYSREKKKRRHLLVGGKRVYVKGNIGEVVEDTLREEELSEFSDIASIFRVDIPILKKKTLRDNRKKYRPLVVKRVVKRRSKSIGKKALLSFSGIGEEIKRGYLLSNNILAFYTADKVYFYNFKGKKLFELGISSSFKPIRYGDRIFIVSDNGYLFSIKNAKILWKIYVGNIWYDTSISVFRDLVIVGNVKGYLHFIWLKTGRILKTINIGDSILSTPYICCNGSVYVATESGKVFIISLPDMVVKRRVDLNKRIINAMFYRYKDRLYVASFDGNGFVLKVPDLFLLSSWFKKDSFIAFGGSYKRLYLCSRNGRIYSLSFTDDKANIEVLYDLGIKLSRAFWNGRRLLAFGGKRLIVFDVITKRVIFSKVFQDRIVSLSVYNNGVIVFLENGKFYLIKKLHF